MPEQTVRRLCLPEDFRLEGGQIDIDVGPRIYGLVCPNCQHNEFSEDGHLSAIVCARCNATLAIRAVLQKELHG